MTLLTAKDNKIIKNTVKLKKSAKHRRKEGLFIAEGVRICMDAMLSKASIEVFFVTEAAMQRNNEEYLKLSGYCAKTYMVTPELFSHISDTQTPQGFLCVVKTLDKSCQFDTIKVNGKMIALDQMQDPNNLGTVLRSAEAFGIDGIILSGNCCDIYSPKVVRGSMGAVFRIPFLICDSIESFLRANPQIESFAAVVDKNATPVTSLSFPSPCAVVIGNEGNGLSASTIEACTHSITIPMNGKAESLNASVAASVLIWEMTK
ncbi:MAG: RNA methyltransferase [Ruminococcus sp.]|nr:RNA methyltransferase [Ruminococcus sp.]